MFFKLNRNGYHHWSHELAPNTLLFISIIPLGKDGYSVAMDLNGTTISTFAIEKCTLSDLEPLIMEMVNNYINTLHDSIITLNNNKNLVENCITRILIE